MYRSGRAAVEIPVISPGLRPMRAHLRPPRSVFPARGVIARFTAREPFALACDNSLRFQGRAMARQAVRPWPGLGRDARSPKGSRRASGKFRRKTDRGLQWGRVGAAAWPAALARQRTARATAARRLPAPAATRSPPPCSRVSAPAERPDRPPRAGASCRRANHSKGWRRSGYTPISPPKIRIKGLTDSQIDAYLVAMGTDDWIRRRAPDIEAEDEPERHTDHEAKMDGTELESRMYGPAVERNPRNLRGKQCVERSPTSGL
jgi:hypothetical protein